MNTHTDTETTAAPQVSAETQLLGIEEAARNEKEQIAVELDKAVKNFKLQEQKRVELEYALSKAEEQMNILSGSATQYRDSQRAQAISRMLLGDTSVELDKLPATDPMASLSVTDLKAGIAQLRRDRSELELSWKAAQSAVNALERKHFAAHAKLHGARYQLARNAIYDAWVELQAAEGASQKHALHQVPQHVAQDFWNIVLPAVDTLDSMKDLRPAGRNFGSNEIKGENIRLTGLISTRAAGLAAEFQNMMNGVQS